jgi:demethylmenaquinone methyltransferase/2-methoxy-6-polyprenyl-1,4-benzoquinol methylase
VAEHVKPYQEEGSKKAQVEKMFDNIARRYDFLNRFLSLGIDVYWRKRAIRQLRKDRPGQVLDVATGTADVALEIYRQLKPAKITGVDISDNMLAIGREKILRKGLEEVITLENGDSENLRFADHSFDAATVAFGVRNFESLRKGLKEMNRVIRPGGKIVILEFSRPTVFPFKQLFQFYFRYILPVIGRITSRDPKAYKYLFESVQAFPQGQAFLDLLSETDFKNGKCIPLTLGVCSIYIAEK